MTPADQTNPENQHKSSQAICVAALYRFASMPNHTDLQAPLLAEMRSRGIRGTILLAKEGINGTIAGNEADIDALLLWLSQQSQGKLDTLEVKKSWADEPPFNRSRVKLKKEIVTLGVPDLDPEENAGTYVAPKDWNKLISDPEVVVIDTRNAYETKLGTFKGALDPKTKSFREFPDYAKRELDPNKHTKVAMYCTGGIRCEKSTAYLKSQGFSDVYHLKGGILKYLEEVPEQESLWDGECFVFDERVSVDHNLQPGAYIQCHACRMPLNEIERNHEHYVQGESCPWCFEHTTDEQRARYREREKQIRLAAERNEAHRGEDADRTAEARRAAKLAHKAAQQLKNP